MRYKTFERDNRRVRLVEFTREFVEPDWCCKGHVGQVHRHHKPVTPRVLLFLVEDREHRTERSLGAARRPEAERQADPRRPDCS